AESGNVVYETQWLPDEVQVLMTLWAQPNIQKQLLTTASDQVFTYLSSELALVGFNKTPRQCSVKVNNLKEEYKKVKKMEPYGVVKCDWFPILDAVFDPDGVTSKEVDSCALQTEPESPEHEHSCSCIYSLIISRRYVAGCLDIR
uniref:Myb/SANT-like DNA-binding domain-containing protein n=1 Tax=Amphilophus citrinellus TaxID=61819 RepID=A0A3Q0SLU8_AMPCI